MKSTLCFHPSFLSFHPSLPPSPVLLPPWTWSCCMYASFLITSVCGTTTDQRWVATFARRLAAAAARPRTDSDTASWYFQAPFPVIFRSTTTTQPPCPCHRVPDKHRTALLLPSVSLCLGGGRDGVGPCSLFEPPGKSPACRFGDRLFSRGPRALRWWSTSSSSTLTST